MGAPFDRAKPVVFIIADGQQFYVTRGSIGNLQKSLFGADFNVVGIIGRGFSPDFTHAALDASGHPDWFKAWQIFNSGQWIEDIESVRRAVVGKNGKITLYGASGGATLVHEYLMKYGSYVTRAYTESAADPELNRELGISVDRFWDEIGADDPSLQPMLLKVLKQQPAERTNILIALQRQHFFVSAEALSAARSEFIRALDKGDMSYLERVRKEYQVDAIMDLFNSATGMPISVREFEFISPTGAFQTLRDDRVDPYIGSEYPLLKPLIDLADAGKIPAPGFKISAAHRLNTEVFILAARHDEAVDYRTSIALAYNYPLHQLFIADDNHLFMKLNTRGIHTRLMRTFLKYGLESLQLKDALTDARPYRWQEPKE
jgi:pimeloyl-ACP methyl ester carboxylesterase